MYNKKDAMKKAIKKALPAKAAQKAKDSFRGLKAATSGIGQKVANVAKTATDRQSAIRDLISKKTR
jgi:hypothetical protein